MAILQPDGIIEDPTTMEEFKKLWDATLVDREGAGWMIRITSPAPRFKVVPWRMGESSHADYSGSPPHGTVCQVHTHPMKLDPKPSTSSPKGGKGDWGVAIRTNKPVYVLSVFAIWKVLPDASEPRFVKVAQDWL
jgi:hypothetical protein